LADSDYLRLSLFNDVCAVANRRRRLITAIVLAALRHTAAPRSCQLRPTPFWVASRGSARSSSDCGIS